MKALINNIREVLGELGAERGPFLFAGLFEREGSPYKWDVVVGAPWISDKRSFIEDFFQRLHQRMSAEEIVKLSRVVIVNPQGEFLSDFNKVIGPVTREMDVSNIRIGEADIHWGHIFPTQSAWPVAA